MLAKDLVSPHGVQEETNSHLWAYNELLIYGAAMSLIDREQS